MIEASPHSTAAPFDFYGTHYGRFGSRLAAAVRREVYGEDLGQTGWRTAAEQAEIALALGLSADSHALDIACGASGPSLDLSPAPGATSRASMSRPPGSPRRTPRRDGAGSPRAPASASRIAVAPCRSQTAASMPFSASMRSTTCLTASPPCEVGAPLARGRAPPVHRPGGRDRTGRQGRARRPGGSRLLSVRSARSERVGPLPPPVLASCAARTAPPPPRTSPPAGTQRAPRTPASWKRRRVRPGSSSVSDSSRRRPSLRKAAGSPASSISPRSWPRMRIGRLDRGADAWWIRVMRRQQEC